MSTFDEILKEKLQTPVPVKGDKTGKTIDPTEAMVNALMANAMKGDIASIAFIRNMTQTADPEKDEKAQDEHFHTVRDYAEKLRQQLINEKAWDGQTTELVMVAETAAFIDELSQRIAAADFQPVTTDLRTGKQTVSPLIQLRDQQRELFDKQLAKLRQEGISRQITRKNLRL